MAKDMFSYLRPRSRQGATNNSEQSPVAESSKPMPDFSQRYPPSQHSPSPPLENSEDSGNYAFSIPTQAPLLPPIPRVASIYGTPPELQEQQNNTSRESYHSRVQSIEEGKVTSQFEFSPKAEQAVKRPHFSRPLQSREGSATPSEERGNLQEIWRTAVQTASSNNVDIKGKKPQVNTAVQNPYSRVDSPSSGSRPFRMPFQDKQLAEASSPSTSLSASGPHSRGASEGSINAPREPQVTSRVTQSKASDSQLSLPMPRSRESTSPTIQHSQPVSSSGSSQPRQSRLTRLNPLTLLTRRRSSQPSVAPENDAYRRNIMAMSNPQKDFVIRGDRVHDFSAPRPRKVVSQQTMASGHSDKSPRDGTSDLLHARTKSRDGSSSFGVPSPSPERKSESPRTHTPAFKENFEDDGSNVWRYDQNDVRKRTTMDISETSSSEYSDSESESDEDSHIRDPLLLGDPTFGLFSASDPLSAPQDFSFIVPKHLAGPPPPPRAPRSRSQTPNHDRSRKGKPYVPPQPPRSSRSRSQTPSSPVQPPRDPRAPRSASTPPLRDSRTPSPHSPHLPRHSKSNASRFSFDMAGFGSSVQEKLLEDKHRQKLDQDVRASQISEISVPETDPGIPSEEYSDIDFGEDLEEDIPGMDTNENEFPMAKSIANSTLESSAAASSSTHQPRSHMYTHQNAVLNLDQQQLQGSAAKIARNGSVVIPLMVSKNGKVDNNDDFYFDDGFIDDADLQDTSAVDESMFDTPHRIGQHLQSSLAPVPEQQSENSSITSSRPRSEESGAAVGQNLQPSTDTSRTSLPPVQPWEKTAVKRSSLLKNDLAAPSQSQAVLTQDNLAAYHDLLALAAQKAATEGRFDRDAGHEDDHRISMPVVQNTVNLDGTNRLEQDDLAPYDDSQDRVTFDDYEQEDDDVIAAANADALNYDEDFYGEEFHFYSKGQGAGESQYGGVFVNEVKRSHSGRANGQDPSLTPITEASEFSTRNSMVSLALNGHNTWHSGSQQPGLAQIADSLQDHDDDLSITSLKRLRHNAFAGSASSLGSGKSGSPPSSSHQSVPPPGTGHSRSQSDRSHPLRNQAEQVVDSGVVQSSAEPLPLIRKPFVKGHSRNSSGAESVTYVQETDAEGSRWVLERRRTTDDGTIEVLGRQIVEGGRI